MGLTRSLVLLVSPQLSSQSSTSLPKPRSSSPTSTSTSSLNDVSSKKATSSNSPAGSVPSLPLSKPISTPRSPASSSSPRSWTTSSNVADPPSSFSNSTRSQKSSQQTMPSLTTSSLFSPVPRFECAACTASGRARCGGGVFGDMLRRTAVDQVRRRKRRVRIR